jgi:transaldolase
MPKLSDLTIKLFTDGADKAQIVEMAREPWIRGFTTNPSLLKKAGVSDYEPYARALVAAVPDRHISFEVFSDDIPEMVAQARLIASWGGNVYVKLPVTNTRGEPLFEAVRALSREGRRSSPRTKSRARWRRSSAGHRPVSRCLLAGSPISASTTGRS